MPRLPRFTESGVSSRTCAHPQRATWGLFLVKHSPQSQRPQSAPTINLTHIAAIIIIVPIVVIVAATLYYGPARMARAFGLSGAATPTPAPAPAPPPAGTITPANLKPAAPAPPAPPPPSPLLDKARADLEELRTAVAGTLRAIGELPASIDVLIAAEAKLPLIDPWGNAYRYVVSTDRQSFRFICNGPDGNPGTNDDVPSAPGP